MHITGQHTSCHLFISLFYLLYILYKSFYTECIHISVWCFLPSYLKFNLYCLLSYIFLKNSIPISLPNNNEYLKKYVLGNRIPRLNLNYFFPRILGGFGGGLLYQTGEPDMKVFSIHEGEMSVKVWFQVSGLEPEGPRANWMWSSGPTS